MCIIYSKSTDKFYIGETSKVVERLKLRNQRHFKKAYTNPADDWKLKLSFSCNSKHDALYLEKFIKRMKIKAFIKNIINNDTVLNQILLKGKPRMDVPQPKIINP